VVVVLVIGGAVGGAVVATSSNSPTTGASRSGTAANGFSVFSDHADSFTIAVPSSWSQIDLSSPGANAAMSEMLSKYPKIGSILRSGGVSNLQQLGMKFFAADPVSGSSMNIIVIPAVGSGDADLPTAEGGIKSAYQKAGLTLLSTSTVSIAGHQALRFKIAFPAGGAGSSSSITETQYFVLANDFAYTISAAGPSPELSQIVSSFSVK